MSEFFSWAIHEIHERFAIHDTHMVDGDMHEGEEHIGAGEHEQEMLVRAQTLSRVKSDQVQKQ